MVILHEITIDQGLILETAALFTSYDVNVTRMNSFDVKNVPLPTSAASLEFKIYDATEAKTSLKIASSSLGIFFVILLNLSNF